MTKRQLKAKARRRLVQKKLAAKRYAWQAKQIEAATPQKDIENAENQQPVTIDLPPIKGGGFICAYQGWALINLLSIGGFKLWELF